MVSTKLMCPIINVNIDCMPHKEWLKALENRNAGEGDKNG